MMQGNPFFDTENNPFLNMKFMNVTPDSFTKLGAQFEGPDQFIQSLMEIQGRNLDALVKAHAAACKGAHSIVTKQAGMMRRSITEAETVIRTIQEKGFVAEELDSQAEQAREAMEAALKDLRELAELATGSQKEAYEILSARAAEGVEELKSLAQPKGA